VRVLAELASLAGSGPFKRLLAARVIGLAGEGALQAGLGALFFFAPERASSPAGVALAFAVLMGPFMIVGPWAGPVLDRWSRRGVLVWGNAARCVLACLIGAAMAAAGASLAVYTLALTALTTGRVLDSAVGAAQPRTVAPSELLTANSIAPTLGTVGTSTGGVIGLSVAALAGDAGRIGVFGIAAGFYTAAAFISAGFPPRSLGPDAAAPPARAALRAVVRGFAQGWSYLVRRRTPALAIAATWLTRTLYALMFMTAILLARHHLAAGGARDGGLSAFATIVACIGAGLGLAALVSPVAHTWVRPENWVVFCAGSGAAGEAVLAAGPSRPGVLAGMALLAFSVQGVKIAVETIIQRDVSDDYRGRAFALNEVAYNAAIVLAAGLTALLLPTDGYSRPLIVTMGGAYLALATGYWWLAARRA
jgi:hypothetical protein